MIKVWHHKIDAVRNKNRYMPNLIFSFFLNCQYTTYKEKNFGLEHFLVYLDQSTVCLLIRYWWFYILLSCWLDDVQCCFVCPQENQACKITQYSLSVFFHGQVLAQNSPYVHPNEKCTLGSSTSIRVYSFSGFLLLDSLNAFTSLDVFSFLHCNLRIISLNIVLCGLVVIWTSVIMTQMNFWWSIFEKLELLNTDERVL